MATQIATQIATQMVMVLQSNSSKMLILIARDRRVNFLKSNHID